MSRLRNTLKWMLFPGLNLHARERYQSLPAYFGAAPDRGGRRVFDAGCGNGMLAYRAWQKGNRVLGISLKPAEVAGCRELFNQHLGIPETELEFRQGNLYHLDLTAESCDEIICSETLEHVRGDTAVCRRFREILKPDGVLHLCAPNAGHPYNAAFPLDPCESGGHVRPGYTLDSYARLLEPIGFEIVCDYGLGSPLRQAFNRRIKETQARFGPAAGLPLFLMAMLVLRLARTEAAPAVPFSLYLTARKLAQQA